MRRTLEPMRLKSRGPTSHTSCSPLALGRDTRNTRPSTGWCCPLDSLLTTRILIAVGTRHGFPRPSDSVLGKASSASLEDPKTPEPGMKPSSVRDSPASHCSTCHDAGWTRDEPGPGPSIPSPRLDSVGMLAPDPRHMQEISFGRWTAGRIQSRGAACNPRAPKRTRPPSRGEEGVGGL